jgi:hypothetical protein
MNELIPRSRLRGINNVLVVCYYAKCSKGG